MLECLPTPPPRTSFHPENVGSKLFACLNFFSGFNFILFSISAIKAVAVQDKSAINYEHLTFMYMWVFIFLARNGSDSSSSIELYSSRYDYPKDTVNRLLERAMVFSGFSIKFFVKTHISYSNIVYFFLSYSTSTKLMSRTENKYASQRTIRMAVQIQLQLSQRFSTKQVDLIFSDHTLKFESLYSQR